MKKAHLLFIPLLLCALNLSAQRFRAGLSAGAVASDVQGTDTRDNDADFTKLGFSLGGIVNSNITKNIILQLEINYIQKGAAQKPDSLMNGSFRLVLNYIEIPLVFRRRMHMTIFKKPSNNFDLEWGASIGRLFSSSFTADNYPQYLGPNTFNKTDVSLLFGFDYNLNNNIHFCVRYSNSVIPAIRHDSTPGLQFLPYTFNMGNNMVFLFAIKFIFGGSNSEQPANK